VRAITLQKVLNQSKTYRIYLWDWSYIITFFSNTRTKYLITTCQHYCMPPACLDLLPKILNWVWFWWGIQSQVSTPSLCNQVTAVESDLTVASTYSVVQHNETRLAVFFFKSTACAERSEFHGNLLRTKPFCAYDNQLRLYIKRKVRWIYFLSIIIFAVLSYCIYNHFLIGFLTKNHFLIGWMLQRAECIPITQQAQQTMGFGNWFLIICIGSS
jgi:hypothetical protein